VKDKLHLVIPPGLSDGRYGTGIFLLAELQSLHQTGYHIHLHQFTTMDEFSGEELKNFCQEVSLYQPNTGHKAVSFKMPFAVASCYSAPLIEVLKNDNAPVVFYGTETASILLCEGLWHKRAIIRNPYISPIKYLDNCRFSSGLHKKLYHLYEYLLCGRYELELSKHFPVVPITCQDALMYNRKQNCEVHSIPMMVPEQQISSIEGKGNYCLFFADFNEPEQQRSASWLLRHVFKDLKIPFVIAGNNPSDKLVRQAEHLGHVCVVTDPTPNELQDLIAKSQVVLMPVFSHTGIKAELYSALQKGRHCLYFGPEPDCNIIQACCHKARDLSEIRSLVAQLFDLHFSEEDIQIRNSSLNCMQTQSRTSKFVRLLQQQGN